MLEASEAVKNIPSTQGRNGWKDNKWDLLMVSHKSSQLLICEHDLYGWTCLLWLQVILELNPCLLILSKACFKRVSCLLLCSWQKITVKHEVCGQLLADLGIAGARSSLAACPGLTEAAARVSPSAFLPALPRHVSKHFSFVANSLLFGFPF